MAPTEALLLPEIVDRFNAAMDEAVRAGEPEPTAMVVATTDGSGGISTRTVLLKALEASGFVFYTNLQSHKGEQLRQCPRAAATFLWKSILCQVQLDGPVTVVSDAEADAYFATRDRGSQIGAWASLQSQPLASRKLLEARVADFERRYEGRDVPRPPHWSGYRIMPYRVEFWHGRPFRLHDRTQYCWADGRWKVQKLFP